MKLSIFHAENLGTLSVEIVERKGYGHPDTLSDALAERLSGAYSKYTLEHFGAVLHHNFDKVGLLGGRSYVSLGKGYLTSPIRVLLNGRATMQFGSKAIPVEKLLIETSRAFLTERLPLLRPDEDIVYLNNISTGSSPGHVEIGDEKADDQKNGSPRSL